MFHYLTGGGQGTGVPPPVLHRRIPSIFATDVSVQTIEKQSDGSRLLIFDDGSVYGEESELDALLALARHREPRACRLGKNRGPISKEGSKPCQIY